MPKGLKAITWDQANISKLLFAIVALHNPKIDYEAVAKIMGPNVPATAVQSYMKRVRKGVAELPNGKEPRAAPVPARASAKSTNGVGKKGLARKRKAGHNTSDEESMPSSSDNDDEEEPQAKIKKEPTSPDVRGSGTTTKSPAPPGPKHQKTLSGRVTKTRSSPRKNVVRKNYQALTDPFAEFNGSATDGEGGKIFDTDKEDSEDSADEEEEGARLKSGFRGEDGKEVEV